VTLQEDGEFETVSEVNVTVAGLECSLYPSSQISVCFGWAFPPKLLMLCSMPQGGQGPRGPA
jgi:hypothetical protein